LRERNGRELTGKNVPEHVALRYGRSWFPAGFPVIRSDAAGLFVGYHRKGRKAQYQQGSQKEPFIKDELSHGVGYLNGGTKVDGGMLQECQKKDGSGGSEGAGGFSLNHKDARTRRCTKLSL